MKNKSVKLSWMEFTNAVLNAVTRRLKSRQDGLFERSKDHKWDNEIQGAAAEVAFAKFAGMYWEPTVNTFKKPDVGQMQIRSTKTKNKYLIVKQNDPDNEPFVLVKGEDQDWEIVGWIIGKHAKLDEYKRLEQDTNKVLFWVPVEDLEPIETLV